MADAAPAIQDAAPAIQSVTHEGDTLYVVARLKPGDRMDDPGKTEVSGAVARRIAEAIQNGASDLPADAKTLNLEIDVPMADRLGHVSDKTFMVADFAVADLKSANVAQLKTAGILNLGEPRNQLLAARSIQMWCGLNHEQAPDFCEKGDIAARFDQQVEDAKQTNAALKAAGY